jgi:hypothetical protein
MVKAFYGAEVWAGSKSISDAVMMFPQVRELDARFRAGKCEDELYEPLTELIQITMDHVAWLRRSDARPICQTQKLSAADIKVLPSRLRAKDTHRNTLEGTNSDFKFVLV